MNIRCNGTLFDESREYFKIFYIHFLWMNDWSQRPKMEFSKTALDQILEPVDAVVMVHFCLKGARI